MILVVTPNISRNYSMSHWTTSGGSRLRATRNNNRSFARRSQQRARVLAPHALAINNGQSSTNGPRRHLNHPAIPRKSAAKKKYSASNPIARRGIVVTINAQGTDPSSIRRPAVDTQNATISARRRRIRDPKAFNSGRFPDQTQQQLNQERMPYLQHNPAPQQQQFHQEWVQHTQTNPFAGGGSILNTGGDEFGQNLFHPEDVLVNATTNTNRFQQPADHHDGRPGQISSNVNDHNSFVLMPPSTTTRSTGLKRFQGRNNYSCPSSIDSHRICDHPIQRLNHDDNGLDTGYQLYENPQPSVSAANLVNYHNAGNNDYPGNSGAQHEDSWVADDPAVQRRLEAFGGTKRRRDRVEDPRQLEHIYIPHAPSNQRPPSDVTAEDAYFDVAVSSTDNHFESQMYQQTVSDRANQGIARFRRNNHNDGYGYNAAAVDHSTNLVGGTEIHEFVSLLDSAEPRDTTNNGSKLRFFDNDVEIDAEGRPLSTPGSPFPPSRFLSNVGSAANEQQHFSDTNFFGNTAADDIDGNDPSSFGQFFPY